MHVKRKKEPSDIHPDLFLFFGMIMTSLKPKAQVGWQKNNNNKISIKMRVIVSVTQCQLHPKLSSMLMRIIDLKSFQERQSALTVQGNIYWLHEQNSHSIALKPWEYIPTSTDTYVHRHPYKRPTHRRRVDKTSLRAQLCLSSADALWKSAGLSMPCGFSHQEGKTN